MKPYKMKRIILLVTGMIALVCSISAQNDYIIKTNAKLIINELEKSQEDKFIKDNFEFLNIGYWQSGMRFMIINSSKDYGGFDLKPCDFETIDINYYFNQIITLDTIISYSKDEPYKGTIRTRILFKTSDNHCLEYNTKVSLEGLCKSKLAKISGIAYLGDVDKARKLLIGKTVYSKEGLAFIDTNDNITSMPIKRLSPYKIKNIGIGTDSEPVKIVLENPEGNDFFYTVFLSGINTSKISMARPFTYYFYFSNPRDQYPNLSQVNWDLVTKGKVKIGWDKNLCKLSWGEPEKINTTKGSFGTHEQWVYLGESYLYFENGKLTTIQE